VAVIVWVPVEDGVYVTLQLSMLGYGAEQEAPLKVPECAGLTAKLMVP
jgi:hypothetical protein